MSAPIATMDLAMAMPKTPLLKRLRSALYPDALSGTLSTFLIVCTAWAVWKFLAWGWLNAETVPDAEICHQTLGACWGVVVEKHRLVFLGRFPFDEQWRPIMASVLLLTSVGFAAVPRFFGKLGLGLLLGGLLGFAVLMRGGVFGLSPVSTELWGGLPLTLFLAVLACLVGMPLGIALALGRRTSLPLLRGLCIGYIELVRGMPLITLLFFGSFVLPMLMPEQWQADPMVRIGVCLIAFCAAYLAEVFRGGLQAVSQGQIHAAQAMGLTKLQTLRYVVLPQALRITIAPTVSSFIGAVKDTSLVAIVNIYDMTGSLKMAMADSNWLQFFVEMYLTVCAVYLLIGLAVSCYGRFLERRYALK